MNVNIGDKFKINNSQYIVCMPDGCYFLINIETGECYTYGLDYEYFIDMIKEDGFIQVDKK